MEEPSRIVPSLRDRKAAEALTVIPAPSVLPWDQVPREPHLLDYIIILRKHQWLILTFLLTVVTVVTIASFKMKPVYEAGARVEGDKESSQSTLAFQTIKSLDLGRYPEFGGAPGGLASGQGGAGAKRPAILGAFLGGLSV